MSEIAIRVEDLGKRYRIGGPKATYGTLRDSLVSLASAPLRAVRRGSANGHQEFWALRDVSFEVKRGEVLGVIGRNGAGKSTLLKILSRITEPTKGYAEIRGRVGSLLEVGTGFHPELTGRENIYLNGAILGMKKAEIDRAFDEIVEFAEIEKFLDTPVKRYSSGMYMRLAFSIAAHLEPEILIVDEVLAVGDAAFQKKCLGKMGDVAKEGRTVLFVSHNMAAIKRLCRECLLLDSGSVMQEGEATEVIRRYLVTDRENSGIVQVDVGNPAIAIIRQIGIMNSNMEFTTSIGVVEEFFVYTDVSIIKRLHASQIAVAILSTASGETVFVTTHMDTRVEHEATLLPGDYQAKVRIPASFLNIGSYTLNLRIWGSVEAGIKESHADIFHALTFTIEETGSVASRLLDRRGGLVLPILEWELMRGTQPVRTKRRRGSGDNGAET